MANQNRYQILLQEIFFSSYKKGTSEIIFDRTELATAAAKLDIDLPKNLGDVIYAVRYRIPLPERVLKTQPKGKEWIIEGAGRAIYRFKLVSINRIVPTADLPLIKIPDSTPEIVAKHSLSDEQALLALVRYNRLIDLFFGVVAYSLQNHLRTTVKGVGQIEIDEIYTAVDSHGRQFVIPVQAKGGADQISVVQSKQDIACCEEKFPSLICRAVFAQFLTEDTVALFELGFEGDQIVRVQEKHYRLVDADAISDEDLKTFASRMT